MLSIENYIIKTIDFEMIMLGRGPHKKKFLTEPRTFLIIDK